jgi:glutamate carboxypeptidase
VAERRSATGPRLLLIGHLDTVFERDSPFQRLERLSPTQARGPGIIDMKGGDVIVVMLMRALRAAGVLDGVNVGVIMTGDEEDVGQPRAAARQALIDLAAASDIAIGFENGAGDPRTAVIARRGFTGWTLQVKATPAHSSQIFRETVGAGAVFEAARILTGFYGRLAREPLLTFNPGLVLAGTTIDYDRALSRGTASGKSNVVAEHATVTGDLRAISREQLEMAKAAMQEIVAKPLPGAAGHLAFDDSYPPMAPTDGNKALLALYDRASQDLGRGPVQATDPRSAGAADIAFAATHVRTALDGIGLMGHSDHTVNETADLATLPTQTARAALLVYRVSLGR